jgi:DhnA family fructose-bisphosphate aldolase class Ia
MLCTEERFHEFVKITPVPVVSIGVGKSKTDIEVLKKPIENVPNGAKGIIFSRNIVIANNLLTFLVSSQSEKMCFDLM